MATGLLLCYWLLSTVFKLGNAFSADEPRGPSLVLEPPPVIEFASESGAVLPCSARGQPEPSISWERKDGLPAEDVPGLRETRMDGSLVFAPFSVSQYRQDIHSATYRCVASSVSGTVKSRYVHVQGVVVQEYSASVYDVYVVRGNAALLRCHVPPAVKDYVRVASWVRDDNVPVGNLPNPGVTSRYLMLPTGGLIVREVSNVDTSRSYRCQVHNVLTGAGGLSTTAGKIIITEPHTSMPPRISERRTAVQYEMGQTAFLPCIAHGNPPPSQSWYRAQGSGSRSGSLAVLSSKRLSPVLDTNRVSLLGGTLVIRDARVQDGGKYVCIVNNSMGEERAETDLLVTAPLSARIEPSVQLVDVGRKANLSCQVTGHPVDGVQWSLNGRPLLKAPRVALINREVLQVSPVQREDGGMYQCLVYNQKDSAQGTAQLMIGENAPVLEHVFQEQEVTPGSSASLRCSATGNPLPQVTWALDGVPVPEVYHIRIGDYVSSERVVHSYVNLTSVRVQDGGLYSCTARNGVGEAEHKARLNVIGPPQIRDMANVTALAGRTANIHCPVSGYPILRVSWQKDGRPLPQNHRQRPFPNGTLIITDVQRAIDSGLYTCIVEGPEGAAAEKQASLDVMIPPVVNPFAFPDDVTEGKRAGAACIVSDGDLPIKITWLKDGKPLAPSLRPSIADANDYASFLSFTGVRQTHTGNYTCVATNPAASVSYTAAMVVQVPPKWLQQPIDKSVVMGQPVTFDCEASGFPLPVIRWKKALKADPAKQFQVIMSNANVQILENGSLSIREVGTEDAGRYMCQAINGLGPGISTVVKLDVHVAAHFERKFQALTVRRGDSLSLSCKARGEPPVTVTWARDRHAFKPKLEIRYKVEEKSSPEGLEYTIFIPRADRRDSSLFSCYAENSYGRDDTNFQVIVQEPPDKPRGLEVTRKTSRTVNLIWSHPYSGNSPVLKYLLEYKTDKDSWEAGRHLITLEPTELSSVVTTLKPKATFEFRLRAENAMGLSDYSDVLVVTTEEEAPSSAARDIKVTPTGSRSLHVVWKPPVEDEAQGSVQGYYIGYRILDSKESYSYKTLEAAHKVDLHKEGLREECHLTDLRKSTKYSVVVQAFNAKGAGPASEEVVAHTLDIDPPPAPTLTLLSATSSSVHLSWEVGREQPIHGFLLHHRAEGTTETNSPPPAGSDEGWTQVQVSGERSAYVFRGLRCGRRYAFQCVAFNAAGKSPVSNMVHAKTDGSVPIPPDEGSLLSTNMSAVRISLGTWRTAGCPISSFAVLYRERGSSEWIPVSGPLPGDGSLVVGDLSPATWYQLLVTAHSEAGATETEYSFATLTLSGGTVPPPKSSHAAEVQGRHIYIIVPVLCTVFMLLLVSAAAYFILSRKRIVAGQPHDKPEEPENSKVVDTVPMSVWEKRESREQIYMPSPYATSRGSVYMGGAGDVQCQPWERESRNLSPDEDITERQHMYDVPFIRRPSSVQQKIPSQDSLLGSPERLANHIYSKPALMYLAENNSLKYQHHHPVSIIEGFPAVNTSYTYSRPKKSWSGQSSPYTEHKLRELKSRTYSDDMSKDDSLSQDEAMEFALESYEFSEAECDMPVRRFTVQR